MHKANWNEQDIVVSPYAFSPKKRAVDIAFAGAGLVLMGILLPLVSMAIWLHSPGPVFYRHARLGLGSNPFTLLKFRTMRVDAETGTNIGGGQADDSRITAVGRMLRRLFIDELPQSWNILRGEMSVVGPRPYILSECEALRKTITGFDHRHYIRPGVTGLAQVNYEHVNEGEEARRKLGYDLEYVRNCSLGMDLRILFRTALRILGMEGT